tara:strand:+ start:842 stop:2317 length:1476 start_codon:yes stop_codon:yes gene_type:complete
MNYNFSIIGAGFSGISAATELASKGNKVTVFEKNKELGGRARSFSAQGFKYDMGPSWYWMPDVFEKYFKRYGKNIHDYLDLKLLDPGFRMIFSEEDYMDVPANFEALKVQFESIERGSASKLDSFMKEAEYKYNVGINKLVYKPGLSLLELLDIELIKGVFKLDVFKSFDKHVNNNFKDERLRMLLKFPVLFLGAKPKDTPALYSLMNYAGLKLGTWYPMGGMNSLVEAMLSLAKDLGVDFKVNEDVQSINTKSSLVNKVKTSKSEYFTDGLIAAADYHHVETKILGNLSNYNESYWENKTFAPSSLIFYLGVNKKIDKLLHHNLFFDTDFEKHAYHIYDDPNWTKDPLFYVCAPSKTDPSVAPSGKENLFVLVPIAAGLEDNEQHRAECFKKVIKRLEVFTKTEIEEHISFKRSFCVNDFKTDYNSYKGNAYGLANTLMQTANLKPKICNQRLQNLFYAGQLTVPGPGVPPSLISGQVSANLLMKQIDIK